MVRSKKTSEMVKMALFIALIILLSVTPLGYIPLGAINATTIQMSVIIGAVLFGWKKGALLGGVFGLTSLIKNTVQPNLTSFVFSPFVPVFGEESAEKATLCSTLTFPKYFFVRSVIHCANSPIHSRRLFI